jgi:hypothetical protein
MCAPEVGMLKVKVPIIFLGTVGFSPPREDVSGDRRGGWATVCRGAKPVPEPLVKKSPTAKPSRSRDKQPSGMILNIELGKHAHRDELVSIPRTEAPLALFPADLFQ